MCRLFNCEDLSGGPISWAVRNSTDLHLQSRVLLPRHLSCFLSVLENLHDSASPRKVGRLAGVDPSWLNELWSRVVQCEAGPDVI